MTYLRFTLVALAFGLLGCKEKSSPQTTETLNLNTPAITDTTKDKQEIQKLIRNLLVWAENHKGVPDLLPFVINRHDSTVTGFDLCRLKGVDDSLKTTGYFSNEFIDNYNKIIRSLDRKTKDKKIAPFSTGEIPPFGFDTDADPWCNCQEVPYDNPNAYSLVDVHIVELNSERGKLYWTWGSLPKDVSAEWKTITYRFNVKKEEGKWKISYLAGFDIKSA